MTDAEAEAQAEAIVQDSVAALNGYELWDGERPVKYVRGIVREDDNSPQRIRHWRMRADELRAAADGFADNSSRNYFLSAAKTYEILADNADARLRRQKKPSSETG